MVTLFLAGSFLTILTGATALVCGVQPPVWRNNNNTCPPRAVCADVFTTPRDWYNGTRCNETRILHHCLCEGGTVCPYHNNQHLLYASLHQFQYVCQPACQLPYCGNIRLSQNRTTPVVAQTLEQNAPNFGGRNYYKMSCRCPRHHYPRPDSPGVQRSVNVHNHIYDYLNHRYTSQFVCTVRGHENFTPDPCPRSTVSAAPVQL